MMKKTCILLLLVLAAPLLKAQKSYTMGVLTMMQYANEDFKSILGNKLEEIKESSIDIYSPKTIIGIGSEKIYKFQNSEMAFYSCMVPLLEASGILRDVLNYVNLKAKAGDFTGEESSDGKGKNTTIVKNKDGKEVIRIISQYIKDDTEDNDYVNVMIFGKAMQNAK